jgi:hypothetical protein
MLPSLPVKQAVLCSVPNGTTLISSAGCVPDSAAHCPLTYRTFNPCSAAPAPPRLFAAPCHAQARRAWRRAYRCPDRRGIYRSSQKRCTFQSRTRVQGAGLRITNSHATGCTRDATGPQRIVEGAAKPAARGCGLPTQDPDGRSSPETTRNAGE